MLTVGHFGIVPAWQASKADLITSLKESGRSRTDGVARQYLRSVLVTRKSRSLLILLIGAGLMINSFIRVQRNNLGADPRNVLTFDFRFAQTDAIKPYGRYRGVGLWDVSETALTFDRIVERMRSVPGVLSVAAINRPPLNSGGIQMPFLIEGRPLLLRHPPAGAPDNADSDRRPITLSVTPNFFGTMKIPIQQGRDFTRRIGGGRPSSS